MRLPYIAFIRRHLARSRNQDYLDRGCSGRRARRVRRPIPTPGDRTSGQRVGRDPDDDDQRGGTRWHPVVRRLPAPEHIQVEQGLLRTFCTGHAGGHDPVLGAFHLQRSPINWRGKTGGVEMGGRWFPRGCAGLHDRCQRPDLESATLLRTICGQLRPLWIFRQCALTPLT